MWPQEHICKKTKSTLPKSVQYVQKHIQNVHNQSIYSCEVCDNKFTIKANLKNHQKKCTRKFNKELFNMSKSYW